jgi:hypothetical protein
MLLLSRKPKTFEVEVDGETVRYNMNRPTRATAIRIVSGFSRVRTDGVERSYREVVKIGRAHARQDCDRLRASVRALGFDPVLIEKGAMEPEEMRDALQAWHVENGHEIPAVDEAALDARLDEMAGMVRAHRAAEAEYMQSVSDDLLEACFGLVFGVEGVETESGPVTDGPDLLALSPPHALVSHVVGRAQELSQLTSTEGKASGSPSTSEPAEKISGGTSGVESAAAGDGTDLATAPETPVTVQ